MDPKSYKFAWLLLILFSVCLFYLNVVDRILQRTPDATNSDKTENNIEITPIVINKSVTQLEENDIIYGPIPKRNSVPIVNEEYNVIFFQVAKAASTEWKRFFARLQGNSKWCAGQGSIHKPQVNKLKHLSDYSLEEAQIMMTSSEWKKVIFVRHPKPRLLSAFLDKAVKNGDFFLENYCPKYKKHGGNYEDCKLYHDDFSFFLKNFTTTPYVKDDMHWRTIYSRIDEKWWPFIDFIGNMDSLNEDAQEFLSNIHSNVDGVSAWDRIGRSGWSDKTSKNCSIAEKSEGQFLGVREEGHMTKAREQMVKYYTPELEALIEDKYADDLHNPYFSFNTLMLFHRPTETNL